MHQEADIYIYIYIYIYRNTWELFLFSCIFRKLHSTLSVYGYMNIDV